MASSEHSSSQKLTVFVIGPGATVQGGISTLVANIQDKCPEDVEYRLIATHSDCKGSGGKKSRLGRLATQVRVYLLALMQVLAALLKNQNKIFHVHLSQEGSALRKGLICILLRATGSQYLIHTHAAEDKLFHPWVPGIAKRVILWGFRGCGYCLVLTPFWADYYADRLSLDRNKIRIMPNPADTPQELPDRSGRSDLKILFLGRIGERKGAFDLIHAFAAIPSDLRQNCKLILAGDGETEKASTLVRVYGCPTQVHVTGWIGRPEVARLLKTSDVLVLPSYAEGMAIAVLEGMAWGLAVITTESGGSTSFLENNRNCLLVTPGDIPAISNAVRELIENEEKRLALGREARSTAETLNLDSYMKKLSLIYRELGRPPVPRSSGLTKETFNPAE